MRVAKPGAFALVLPFILVFQSAASAQQVDPLVVAAREAENELRQTFTNLQFEDFGPAPVKGPIYQASAGGRIIYYAPESEHLLFAAVYDRNGINITALAQDRSAQRKLAAIDTSKALAIGPADAPQVIEFTDPDCPYCRALDRFWAAKEAEGKPVRRLIIFVSGIHPEAAAKAEHILCSPDKEAAFKTVYAGAAPVELRSCAEGRARVDADARVVSKAGITGTPTLIVGGKIISGFQQAELEEFLKTGKALADAAR
ncbi:DsbC family protein [Sphingobium sp. H39-3-25]|uniref:DsbC family protein n=1 Tax=Sphingobium TaxID=165695 RepID=UPI0023B9268F|nr:DsbC family protein [Sphingobium arseniciresistens]